MPRNLRIVRCLRLLMQRAQGWGNEDGRVTRRTVLQCSRCSILRSNSRKESTVEVVSPETSEASTEWFERGENGRINRVCCQSPVPIAGPKEVNERADLPPHVHRAAVEAEGLFSVVAFHFPVGVSDDFADRGARPQDFGSLCPRWNVNSARKLLVRGIKPF